MRRVQRLVWSAGTAAALVMLAGGCASIQDHRGYIADRTLIDAVQPGIDNRTSVERTLGRPTFVSEFGRQDWYYVSVTTKQHPFQRPRPKDEMILRVRFDQGDNVVGVDKAGMEKVAKISPEGKATATLGAKRGLLEDLFGNIGAVGAGGAPGGGDSGGGGTGPNGS